MQKVFHFKNVINNIKKIEFLAPEFVYIPITKKVNNPISVNDKVQKGVYFNNSDFSSVSGKIIGSKICYNINKKFNSLVIKNDYKEQRIKKIKENKIDRIKRLVDSNLLLRLQSGCVNLVLCCFNDQPYTYNNEILIPLCYQDVLDILYLIKDGFGFKQVYIVVKDIQTKSIEKFMKVIGSYPELKFITIPNIYPVNGTDYYKNTLKIDNYCLLTFEELYDIYHIIKCCYSSTETYITINIDNKNPIVVKTKIGISVKELFDNIKINYDKLNIYVNGTIGGININNINDLIVTKDLHSIILTSSFIPSETKCLNCGNCYKYCPKHIDPKKAIFDKEYRKKAKETCIKCGLCNYICPSYIKLMEGIEGKASNEAT